MRMITFTKKKIKRLTAIGILAAATAAAGIGAIVTSVGTQASERRIPVYSVERGDNKISLTFDVAWENSNTQQLIDILDEYDARATFFVTGDWCDRYPEDVRMFAEAGHEIQNHSDQHPHVKGMNVNELITDAKAASSKIKDITGREPTLYRAPYGEYDDTVITTVEGMGMTVIQWDVEAIDTDGKPLPEPVQATGAVFSIPSEFSVRGCSFWISAIMYAASHGHLRLFHAENVLLHAGFYLFLGKVVKYHRAAEDIEVS